MLAQLKPLSVRFAMALVLSFSFAASQASAAAASCASLFDTTVLVAKMTEPPPTKYVELDSEMNRKEVLKIIEIRDYDMESASLQAAEIATAIAQRYFMLHTVGQRPYDHVEVVEKDVKLKGVNLPAASPRGITGAI